MLVIVLCGIALTLAYPVREYIADRRQIDQLEAQNAQVAAEVKHLRAEQRALASPARIEQEARDNLHMCFPSQTCYEVIYPARAAREGRRAAPRGAVVRPALEVGRRGRRDPVPVRS